MDLNKPQGGLQTLLTGKDSDRSDWNSDVFPKSSFDVIVLAQMVSQHLPYGLRLLVLCLHFSPRL